MAGTDTGAETGAYTDPAAPVERIQETDRTGATDGTGPPGASATPAAEAAPRPRKVRALLIGCVIAAALAVFLFIGLGSSSGSGPSGPVVGIGSQAPDFSLPSLTGGTLVRLDAVGRSAHHPVILNFFASWCGPCQKETPLLAQTAAAQQAKGSTVRFVGVDVNDLPSDALAFVRRSGITYPVGVDKSFDVTSGKYALYGLPQTFFIDAEGRVVGHIQGAVTQGDLARWLHRLGGSST